MQTDTARIVAERARSQRSVQITLSVLSLATMMIGLGFHACADRLGVGADSATIIAGAFVGAGIMHAAALFAWEHVFRVRA